MTEILPESIPLEFEGTPVQDVMVSKPIAAEIRPRLPMRFN